MPRTANHPIAYLRTYRRMHTNYSQQDIAFLLGYQTHQVPLRDLRPEHIDQFVNILRSLKGIG